jgi:hypothetical protein
LTAQLASTSPLMNLGAAFWGICPLVVADVPLPFPGFFIFSLQPQTVNCHAPQTVTMRMRNKRRNAPGHVVNGAGGGGAPPPTHTEPPMARIPGRGRLSTMGASSPLEYCSLKQEIAKKALFENDNLMRRTASAISYQYAD